MRFEETSGQRFGEMEAELVRVKMQRSGLEVERDSLKRCCDDLVSRLASLEAFVEAVRVAWSNITTREFTYDEDKDKFVTWFIGYEHKEKIDAALAKLDGKE